jgi:3-phenylpropionate/trans-cinnamate dioxygenase ferredoxin reductase subunit
MSGSRVVIVGAGHAGGTAAALLRQYGYEGAITLIGDEPIPPYQRPPLSKAWLKGEADADSLALKPIEFYAEAGIDFRPSVTVTALDRGAKTVALSDGASLVYDHLILATGARAIALPIEGKDLAGILFLRTAADAEALKAQVGPGKTLVVVGGGYIGLEVAASRRGGDGGRARGAPAGSRRLRTALRFLPGPARGRGRRLRARGDCHRF